MAILQTKKQTDLEKRLKVLRQQIYGKEKVVSSMQYVARKKTEEKSTPTTNYQLPTTDLTYLYQDLFKIGILATCALGIQIILFFLIRNHILVLNFF